MRESEDPHPDLGFVNWPWVSPSASAKVVLRVRCDGNNDRPCLELLLGAKHCNNLITPLV